MSLKPVVVSYDRDTLPTPGSFRFCPLCANELNLREISGRRRQVCPACGFINFRNPSPAVGVLVTDGERVLLGQRKFEPGPGKWALPSGYIEFEEDYLTCAIREAHEETGLRIRLRGILNVESGFLSPRYHFFTVYLLAEVAGGEIHPGDDLQAVEWFPLGGPLPEMAFQQDIDLIGAYHQYRPGNNLDWAGAIAGWSHV